MVGDDIDMGLAQKYPKEWEAAHLKTLLVYGGIFVFLLAVGGIRSLVHKKPQDQQQPAVTDDVSKIRGTSKGYGNTVVFTPTKLIVNKTGRTL